MLLLPLRFNYLLGATVVLLLVLLFYRRAPSFLQIFKEGFRIQRNRANLFLIPFIAACICLYLLLGALMPVNLDTYIYHLQIIRWTNEYGVVPGVANLYPRFGLGSNWFNLISFFYIPSFQHQNFSFLNTTAVIWVFLWLVNKWAIHYSQKDKEPMHKVFAALYFLLLGYFLFDWQLFRDASNSTSYDFIITSLTLLCITFLSEEIFFQSKPTFSPFFLVAAIATIPFKLSGILILFLLVAYLLPFRKFNVWVKTGAIGIVIVLPLLIKNYIATGYPLFPFPVSISHPDWQLPLEMTAGLNDYIMNVNKFYNYQVSFINEQDISTFNWIPFWIKTILLKHKILLGLGLFSVALFFYNPAPAVSHRRIRLFIAALWLMLAAWFFTAPDPRFGFSFILFLAFFPLCLFLGRRIPASVYQYLFIIAIIPLVIYGLAKWKTGNRQAGLLAHVMPIETPPAKKILVDTIPFYLTRMDSLQWLYPCAFSQLPCMGENNPFVRPRGNRISDGFYMNPSPDSVFIRNYNY